MEFFPSDVKTWLKYPKTGIYYVTIPGRDGRWKSSGQNTHKEAIRWALVQAQGEKAVGVAFSVLAKDFFIPGRCKYIATQEDGGEVHTRDHWAKMRSVVDNYLLPKWGKYQLQAIRPGEFHLWLLDLTIKGSSARLSGRSRKRIREIMVLMFNWAVLTDKLEASQMAAVPKIRQKSKKTVSFLADERAKMFPPDLARVWPEGDNLHSLLPGWGAVFLLHDDTGCRPQEVLALHWEDYRWDRKAFIVHRKVSEGDLKEGLKTQAVKSRAVAVSDQVDAMLQVGRGSTGLIFWRPLQAVDVLEIVPLRVDTAGKVFRRVLDFETPKGKRYYAGLEKIEVDRKDRRLYGLRHSKNTRTITDASRKAAQEVMGHVTDAMTDNYDDPDEEDLLARIGRGIESVTAQER